MHQVLEGRVVLGEQWGHVGQCHCRTDPPAVRRLVDAGEFCDLAHVDDVVERLELLRGFQPQVGTAGYQARLGRRRFRSRRAAISWGAT